MVFFPNLQAQVHLKYYTTRQEYIYKTFYVQVLLILGISYPQISDLYTNIGKTSLSNTSRDNEIGKPPTVFMTRFSVNTALSACADNVRSGTDQHNLEVKTIPTYV